jgi:ATP-dependent RNA helicase SUPV3L1/SUV3
MAEKLFRAAHEQRGRGSGRDFTVDPALAVSMGLHPDSFRTLMRDAGFRAGQAAELPEGAFGPPTPMRWNWRPPRKDRAPRRGEEARPREGSAFAGLAELVR